MVGLLALADQRVPGKLHALKVELPECYASGHEGPDDHQPGQPGHS